MQAIIMKVITSLKLKIFNLLFQQKNFHIINKASNLPILPIPYLYQSPNNASIHAGTPHSHIHSKTACRGVSERQWRSAANRPSRQARQVLLPMPQNRRKHWVFAGFLFTCVAWFWCSFGFGLRVFSSGLTRSQPFPSPPAPRTHPVSPFSG